VSACGPSLHAIHLGLLAVALAGSILYGWSAVASLALGGGIQALNLRALERSVRLMVASTVESGSRAKLAAHAASGLRLLLLLALLTWVMVATPVAPLPFSIGLLLVVPALAWFGFNQVRQA
jgi:hypothetical protein